MFGADSPEFCSFFLLTARVRRRVSQALEFCRFVTVTAIASRACAREIDIARRCNPGMNAANDERTGAVATACLLFVEIPRVAAQQRGAKYALPAVFACAFLAVTFLASGERSGFAVVLGLLFGYA